MTVETDNPNSTPSVASNFSSMLIMDTSDRSQTRHYIKLRMIESSCLPIMLVEMKFEARREQIMDPICQSCLASPAQVYCRNDSAYMCKTCDENYHKSTDLFLKHERVMTSLSPIQFGCCPNHPDKSIERVCLTCNRSLCSECLYSNDHAYRPDHNIVSSFEAYRQARESLKDSTRISGLNQAEQEATRNLDDMATQVSRVIENLESNSRAVEKQIYRSFGDRALKIEAVKKQSTMETLFAEWVRSTVLHALHCMNAADFLRLYAQYDIMKRVVFGITADSDLRGPSLTRGDRSLFAGADAVESLSSVVLGGCLLVRKIRNTYSEFAQINQENKDLLRRRLPHRVSASSAYMFDVFFRYLGSEQEVSEDEVEAPVNLLNNSFVFHNPFDLSQALRQVNPPVPMKTVALPKQIDEPEDVTFGRDRPLPKKLVSQTVQDEIVRLFTETNYQAFNVFTLAYPRDMRDTLMSNFLVLVAREQKLRSLTSAHLLSEFQRVADRPLSLVTIRSRGMGTTVQTYLHQLFSHTTLGLGEADHRLLRQVIDIQLFDLSQAMRDDTAQTTANLVPLTFERGFYFLLEQLSQRAAPLLTALLHLTDNAVCKALTGEPEPRLKLSCNVLCSMVADEVIGTELSYSSDLAKLWREIGFSVWSSTLTVASEYKESMCKTLHDILKDLSEDRWFQVLHTSSRIPDTTAAAAATQILELLRSVHERIMNNTFRLAEESGMSLDDVVAAAPNADKLLDLAVLHID